MRCDMLKEEKGKSNSVMSAMKPIQATPELNGGDARKILSQVNVLPTESAYKKNIMLHNVLENIRKP